MSETEHTPMDEDEWERRTLCSDGNCIGVIGPDGRCKECGRPHEGKWPEAPAPETASESDAVDDRAASANEPPDDLPEPETPEPVEEVTEPHEDEHWSHRRLCRDGNCIGVIGPDGRCKECGLPADEVD